MKKLLLLALFLTFPAVAFAAPQWTFDPTIIPITDNTYDLGSSTPSLYWRNLFIKGNITNPNKINGCASWSSGILTSLGVACGSGGGGSGGGTWATTTSTVSGQFINYSLNNTDIITIGGTATTSAKFYFDPNTNTLRFTGNGTTTGVFNAGINVTAPYFNATSSIASILPYASTTQVSHGDGSGANPSMTFTSDPDTGVYHAGTNSVGLSGGGSGVQFNGNAWFPNSSARTLGLDANPWASLYVGRMPSGNWNVGTSSLTANTLRFTNSGYPSVIIGADDAATIANVEINSQLQGPYTSFGLRNNNGGNTLTGAMVIDNTNSIGGITGNIVLQNISGGGSCLMTPLNSGNGTACARTYNGLATIFNVIAPYNSSGTESNVSETMVNSDGGNNTLDLGLEDYPGATPTGKQMYLHALASDFSTRMPVLSFAFWNQGCGNSSNATCSFGWMTASSTSSSGGAPGAVGTSTVIALGDPWVNGYSKGGTTGLDYGVQGVADGTGATIQIVSTSTRQKALEVFSRSGNTYTSLFTVGKNGATTTNATSTNSLYSPLLTSTTICLTSDTCRTTWPTSGGGGTGSGNVSTSSAETSGQIPYWTSNSATPALLSGGSSSFTFDGTKFVTTYASTTYITATTASTTNLNSNTVSFGNSNLGVVSTGVLTGATGLPLTTGVTGTLPILNGGTNGTAFSSGGMVFFDGSKLTSCNTAGTCIVDSNGLLGVGSSSPSNQYSASFIKGLYAGGNSIFGGTLTSTSTSANVFPYASTTALTASGFGYLGNLFVTGSSTLQGQLNAQQASTTQLSITSNGINTPLAVTGNINGFLEGSIQNSNNGASASSDWVATADNGSATTHYINMGINGSGGATTPFTTQNDSYLYASDDTLNIGAIAATKDVNFFAGGSATSSMRLKLQSNGNVNVGTSTGYSKLTVFGGGTALGQTLEVVNSASTTLFMVWDNGQAYHLGNLGIGTTSPYAKLSVVGQVVAAYFTATTSTASTFPYASTTALSATTVCLSTDCRTAWPSAGSGTYPFVPATTYNTISSGTSTPLWLQGTPYSLFASTTAVLTYASTTLLSASNLISGNCVQASTGGMLTTVGSACGSGGNAASKWATTSPTQGVASTAIAPAGAANVGIGTSTPWWNHLFSLATTTGQQLNLIGASTEPIFSFRNIGNHLTIATSSPNTGATSTANILDIDATSGAKPYFDFATSSPGTAVINLGNNPGTTNGSTTIMMNKLQWDGYDSAGVRRCTYINSAGALTSQTGACNN